MNHYREIRRVLLVTLVANVAVALLKVFMGKATGSVSMTADGFHSLADGTSNVVGLIGITLAARPADADHPYGHRKYETLAAAGIAGLLFFACQHVIVEAISRLSQFHLVEVGWASFAVMGTTVLANLAVNHYERRAGERLGSDLLVADASHTLSDVYVSLSVLGTLVAVRLGYPILDLIASLFIAALIARAGYLILREVSTVLCDRAVIEPVEVEQAVLAMEGVRSCHAVRSRGRQDDVSLDLHIEVEPTLTLEQAHQLSHAVAAHLKKRFPGVSDVLVHVEPPVEATRHLEERTQY